MTLRKKHSKRLADRALAAEAIPGVRAQLLLSAAVNMNTKSDREQKRSLSVDGELWIPRTMWEKRRQLSGVVQRAIAIGRSMLVMSCDDWTTFRNRLDAVIRQGDLEYLQVAPLMGDETSGTDLSRIMGRLGPKSAERHFDLVVVDDVDLIIDLRSEEAAVASMFALLYALKARFGEISLFSNPLRTDWELEYLNGMRDFLKIHAPAHTHVPHQNVA